jgi:hypothetical protein
MSLLALLRHNRFAHTAIWIRTRQHVMRQLSLTPEPPTHVHNTATGTERILRAQQTLSGTRVKRVKAQRTRQAQLFISNVPHHTVFQKEIEVLTDVKQIRRGTQRHVEIRVWLAMHLDTVEYSHTTGEYFRSAPVRYPVLMHWPSTSTADM